MFECLEELLLEHENIFIMQMLECLNFMFECLNEWLLECINIFMFEMLECINLLNAWMLEFFCY